jgi:hypothetical protein
VAERGPLDERQANTLRIAGAVVLALSVLPAAWFAVAMTAVKLGGLLHLGTDGTEALIKLSWFVGPPVGGFLGLWAAATLVRDAPVRPVFIAFCIAVGAMFTIAMIGFIFGGGFTEPIFTGGMLAQLALVIAGAWLGWWVAERGRG